MVDRRAAWWAVDLVVPMAVMLDVTWVVQLVGKLVAW